MYPNNKLRLQILRQMYVIGEIATLESDDL